MTPPSEQPSRFDGHHYPQVIPEPEVIEPGAPAPWSTLPLSSRSGLALAAVRDALEREGRLLENGPASEVSALSVVGDASPTPITVRSAVLLALFEEEGETRIILTRRAFSLRHHRGEIALPGGRLEGEETPVEGALREAREEVGLDPELVTPFAWLSPLVSYASGTSIWPVVGLLGGRPELTIDPSEVDRVFSVAIADLVAEGAFLEERWRRASDGPRGDRDGFFPIQFFKVPGDVIWGATSRVLTEFLCVVTGVPTPDHG
jgi:8-oxo-dGTP pyrophosphatase MutT (NUDIX family)